MSASYPAAPKSFTAITSGDTITDTMWEDAYDEITAIEQALVGGSGLAHDLKFVDATYDIGKSGATRPRDLFLSRNFTLGGVATGASQPRAAVFNTTAQTIGTAAWTAITFNSEDIDSASMHDTSSNTSRITVPAGGDGWYLVSAIMAFQTSAAGTVRRLRIQKNGATVANYLPEIGYPPSATLQELQITGALALVAGDYIELQAFQDSGGNLTTGTTAGGNPSSFIVTKLW